MTLAIKRTTGTGKTSLATTRTIGSGNVLGQTSTGGTLLAALSTVRSCASTVAIGRTTVSKARASTSSTVPGTTLRVGRNTRAETVGKLTSRATKVISLSTVSVLRTTVTILTTLASLSVLTTASVGRNVVRTGVASTEFRLAACFTVVRLTAVALSRTAVTVSASLTSLAILTTVAIGGDVARFAVASAKLGLAASITVRSLATPVPNGTAVTEGATLASLAIEASTSTISRDLARISITGAELRLTACFTMVCLATVSLFRAAISISASLAGLTILAAMPICRNVGLGITVTELGLTTSRTEAITLATVAIGRAAVSP
ncbi:hypothetical protein HG531_003959 [Fusarium graminearum]|nr:hypothetical protein HG531_003959 [Fusarium graminearum]